MVADPAYATPNQQPATQGAEQIPTPVARQETAEERIADYTLALTVFTAVLAAATIGLIYATHNLGERADKGMRILERASVHPTIIGHNMDDIRRITDPIASGFPQVTFRATNFGKTPAFIVQVDHSFTIDGEEAGDPMRERLNAADDIIGPDNFIEHTDQAVLTERGQREAIAAGDVTLRFHVRVVYEDIWQDRWGSGLEATYDAKAMRFTWRRTHTALEKR